MKLAATFAIFAATYAGMAFGRIPGLRIDRSGIAMLGAIAMIACGALSPEHALAAIDFPTLLVLFGLMIVSGQLGTSGFYDLCAARITELGGSPLRLLAGVIFVSGVLSALLTNDVVVFALTPLLCRGLARRNVDPKPYLVALAAAANAGSAATPIGNPQNVAIAQVGSLPFLPFVLACALPAIVALAIVYAVVRVVHRQTLARPAPPPVSGPAPTLDRPRAIKAGVAIAILVAGLLLPVPNALVVVAVAGALLVSRRVSSRQVLEQIDWPLLSLFASLFIVTAAFAATGEPSRWLDAIAAHGLAPDRARMLVPLAIVGSNTIGNVPLVALLLSVWRDATPGTLHALASLTTLAGNLTIAGSLANIIVAERASAEGVTLGFAEHARCGVAITLTSIVASTAWFLALRAIAP